MTDRLIIEKRKKPNFTRQQPFLIKFKKNLKWRRPKGLHSKLRIGRKGHTKKPSVGYGSPKNIKYLSKKGLENVLVSNLRDLEKIDIKKQGITIKSSVGAKNKIKILEEVKKKNIFVFNFSNIDDYIKKVNEKLEKNKKISKEKEEKKKKAKKEAEKKAEEKKKEEEKPKTEEEVKEESKKEKEDQRKILEKGL